MSEDFQNKVKQYKEMGKTAFIIGYTGECGKELVKALSKNKIFSKVVLIGRRKVEISPDPGPEFEQKVVDYDKLEEYTEAFQGNQVGYCCLGTTRHKAGKEGFIKVDRDYVLKSAEIAKSTGCQHFSVVTASTSDKNSMFLYVKTKGEVEEGLKGMGFDKLSIFRPAMLLCDRSESRLGETFARACFKPWAYLFPTVGSVPTSYVGRAMVVDTVMPGDDKIRTYSNAEIHGLIKQDNNQD
ncbi:oxidoreductase HTATIP2-like [Mizuhopecten yessoensis]|uniref:Protein HTATIP2 n=1 Tax=Mizuhopecten yessoensis TaxID=6573 RepID=A0A210PG50_MIZYE|nr:oxidoreductase HTATIP2-like [Mizuhopecten yessoensis]XP_021342488.1 oxidoreductase HTATIP2-like [Mizuhopecten yessoensis]OWF35470.1 Oxidoreductase HTATIP2 [Mizuhopecten yessoensis]